MSRPDLVARWEGLPARRQVAIAYPTITILLLALHVAFFHRITVARSIGYAIFEGALITGLLVLATQSEIARKHQAPPAEPPAAPRADSPADTPADTPDAD